MDSVFTRWHLFLPVCAMVTSCVLNTSDVAYEAGYWPDASHQNAVVVSLTYMEETVDDKGRRWMTPGTAKSASVYRLNENGSLSEFRLEYPPFKIAGGAGSIWALASNFSPDSSVVWLTPSNMGTVRLFKIDPDTGSVIAAFKLPKRYEVAEIEVREGFVLVKGRKQTNPIRSRTYLETEIDPESLEIVSVCESKRDEVGWRCQ